MGNRDELGQMIKGQHRYCLEKNANLCPVETNSEAGQSMIPEFQ